MYWNEFLDFADFAENGPKVGTVKSKKVSGQESDVSLVLILL